VSKDIHRKFSRFLVLLFIALSLSGHSQDSLQYRSLRADSGGVNKARLAGVLTVGSACLVGSLAGLYFAWYRDYPQSSFHFFDDDDEWLQMDKCGHLTASYTFTMITHHLFRWTGMSNTSSAWFAGLVASAFMLNIEILDGFSSQWGFSVGDFTANTLGCAVFISQQLIWKEQRFYLKYSFHQTTYPVYRPDLLGSNLAFQALKDYNGQSYWLSGNISSFLPKSSKFPKWLNVAFGYGAGGMTGANSNSLVESNPPRYRRFMLSVDVDLTRIPTRSKFLKAALTLINLIKIPAPAIEYNTLGNFVFYPIYY
jgi:hypothetical protein